MVDLFNFIPKAGLVCFLPCCREQQNIAIVN